MPVTKDGDHPNPSAIKLFESFARFEYALKATGFCDEQKTKAEVNWTAFADNVSDYLNSSQNSEFNAAKKFLFDSPPKQQIVENGSLKWQEIDRTESRSNKDSVKTKALLLHVRQVRNNLFHGGKIVGRKWFAEDGRSEHLVKHSLTIIQECLEACPEVKANYK